MGAEYYDRTTEAFFILLRAGLWERKPEDLRVFPLSAEEWKGVSALASKQTVTAIVYDGMCMLPDGFMPPENILLKMVAATDMVERMNRNMNAGLSGLLEFLKGKGVSPVLQKGQGVASFYGNPLHRECGDIDLYFPCINDMDRALRLVADEGCDVVKMSDGSHCFRWNGVDVELHPFLIDVCDPFRRKYAKELERKYGFIDVCLKGLATGEVTVPSPMVNIILLDTHIMKHVLGWGIGMRQLCDMARACYRLQDLYDKDDMRKYCRKLGIDRWTRLLNAFMVDYLGLEEKYLPYHERENTSVVLMDIVMRGGNFGVSRKGRVSGSRSGYKGKLNTMGSFLGNMRFVLKYAPAEGFWTFAGLVKGQL